MISSRAKSYILLILTAGIYGLVYLSLNKYSYYYHDQNYLFFEWELKIPLIELFILVYFSAYLSFLPVFCLLKYKQHLKIAKSLILSALIGGLVFLIYPTECGYERDLDKVRYLKFFFSFIWGQDYPVTLMPSFHVAMSSVFLLPMIRISQKKTVKFIYFFWLLMICISIILVHQHHLIDIFTGLVLSYLSLSIFFRGKYFE